MSDRIFFSLCAIAAMGLIALALVWPQGLGARSPEPFARALAQPAPPPPGSPPPPGQPGGPSADAPPPSGASAR